MHKTKVIKRDGRVETFNVQKVKQQIRFACHGTEIQPEVFEANLKTFIPNEVKTSELQETLLYSAKSKIDAFDPDWQIVAARLKIWDIYGTVYKTVKIPFNNWMDLVIKLVDEGFYKLEVLEKLKQFNITSEDFDYGTWKNMSYNNPDLNLVLSQVAVYYDKYIIKQNKKPIEYPFMIHIANAALLADSREEFFNWYKLLSENFISLATPFLSNLRKPNGNTGSCFIGTGSDSILGLTKSWEDVAIISKEGGGIGWDLSEIRPGYTYTDNIVESNEITAWSKIFNDIILAVNQSGIRKGALTLANMWWHLDIVSFMEAKSETAGDIRTKTFDIYPQIVIDDYFVDAVLNDKEVYLVNQYELKKYYGLDLVNAIDEEAYRIHEEVKELIEEGKFENTKLTRRYKKIRARDLWKKILWLWIEVGELYITHKDNINMSNYLKHSEKNRLITRCTNLCTESFSVNKTPTKWKQEVDLSKSNNKVTTETDGMYHACNLTSINVVKLIDADEETIYKIVDSAVRMLDKSIDLGTFPVEEAKKGSYALRNIGLGVLGVADYLAYYKEDFATESGQNLVMKLMERIAFNAYKVSIQLAIEKGSYPLFEPSLYDHGLFGKPTKELERVSRDITGNNYDWGGLIANIKLHGIRNFLLLAEAPNTSTGLAMGVTASYLPVTVKNGTQELANMVVPVLPKFIKDRNWYYKERVNYNMVDIVKYTRKFQYFIDTGVSMELNLNPDLTRIDELSQAFLEGFKAKELKAIYYNKTTECTSCAN